MDLNFNDLYNDVSSGSLKLVQLLHSDNLNTQKLILEISSYSLVLTY